MALNTIHVSFDGQNETITKKRYQYDKGQVCVFDDIELPEAYKVIFSNNLTGENSIPMIGGENGVRIPDDFFLTGLTIYGWVYLSEGNDDGQTVKHFTIPVEKRVRETDEEPTPEEQTEIEQALVALNNAVAKTTADVVTTTEKAEQAATSAQSAATSATEASGYLEGVTAKANEAAASASLAAQSATTASQKAAETAAGVSRAEQAAEGAEAAKTAAQSAQAAAEGYAEAAGASAQAASTSATQAAGSATSASGFAGDANTSAQAAASSATTASTKATEAAQSASTASTAATNAINAKTAAETAQGKAEDAQEAAETAQEAAETAVESIQGKSEQIDQNTEDIGDLKAEISHKIDKPETAGTSGQVLTSDGQGGQSWETPSSPPVSDVQVNGTSVVNQGVANVPIAVDNGSPGVVKLVGTQGIGKASNDALYIVTASANQVKAGTNDLRPITPTNQNAATFYGLAKAASDTTQSTSSNPVGTYTDTAKIAIQKMLGLNQQGELIADVTATEDLVKLEITTDINGEPFNLRVLKAYAIIPASTTGIADNISALIRLDRQNSPWVSLPTMKMHNANGSLNTYEMINFEVFNIVHCFTVSNFNSTATNSYSMAVNQDFKSIKGFRLQQYGATTTLIPSGTRIVIYGVRL